MAQSPSRRPHRKGADLPLPLISPGFAAWLPAFGLVGISIGPVVPGLAQDLPPQG